MAVEAEALQSVPRVEPVLVQIFANRGPSRAVTPCSPLAAPPPVPDLFQVAYFSRSSFPERAKASAIGDIRIMFALIKRQEQDKKLSDRAGEILRFFKNSPSKPSNRRPEQRKLISKQVSSLGLDFNISCG